MGYQVRSFIHEDDIGQFNMNFMEKTKSKFFSIKYSPKCYLKEFKVKFYWAAIEFLNSFLSCVLVIWEESKLRCRLKLIP